MKCGITVLTKGGNRAKKFGFGGDRRENMITILPNKCFTFQDTYIASK